MPTSTPWGSAQNVTSITRGIRSVSTAGHGGILVSPTKNAMIPEYMRESSGAYEEDCEWAIPAVVFEKEWREWANTTSWTTGDIQMECAWSTLKNWNPNAYQKFTGKTLEIGESYVNDERILKEQVRNSYVVRSASEALVDGVRTGMVKVVAIRESDGSKIHGLVPQDEYKNQNRTVGKAKTFVFDPDRHQIIPILESAI